MLAIRLPFSGFSHAAMARLLCGALCCAVIAPVYGHTAANTIRAPITSSAPVQGAPETIAPAALPQRAVNPAELFALMSEEAKNGNLQAMLQMGLFYERGIGTTVHFGKALEWYKKAADANLPEGLYNAGVCYEIGMGTAPDLAAAMQYFERSAVNLPQGAYKMALIYLSDPVGVRADKGVAMLTKAAGQGHAGAANDLGAILLQGLYDRKKDTKQALTLFVQAADAGSLEAAKNIGVIFMDGLGQKPDPVKAFKWYSIARQGGYPVEAVDPILSMLKRQLTPDQLITAEAEAGKWIADYKQKQGKTPQRTPGS